jgi:uncharacterized SAM-binding protein YcdF (DUF218 family)
MGAGRTARFGVGLAVGALGALLADALDLPSFISFWSERSALMVALSLLAALLWLTRARVLVGLTTAALAVLWLAVSFTPLVPRLVAGMARRDALGPADAVFVFGSRIQADGEPTIESTNRLLKAVELLADRRARVLIVSELQPPSRAYAPIAREWLRRFAPQAEVLAVGPVVNTHDEAVLVARLFRARGWKRVLAVSSPLHLRRASAALEREGLEVVAVPALETRFDLETLDLADERRHAFAAIGHERLGLLVYARRGWIREGTAATGR